MINRLVYDYNYFDNWLIIFFQWKIIVSCSPTIHVYTQEKEDADFLKEFAQGFRQSSNVEKLLQSCCYLLAVICGT